MLSDCAEHTPGCRRQTMSDQKKPVGRGRREAQCFHRSGQTEGRHDSEQCVPHTQHRQIVVSQSYPLEYDNTWKDKRRSEYFGGGSARRVGNLVACLRTVLSTKKLVLIQSLV